MAVSNPQTAGNSGDLVTVSDWSACFNSGDGMLVLSCTVTANDSTPCIGGVGLILNTAGGVTLASIYTEWAGNVASATPAINVGPGSLAVGDSVEAVVSGEANGQHYFFEERLTIGNC